MSGTHPDSLSEILFFSRAHFYSRLVTYCAERQGIDVDVVNDLDALFKQAGNKSYRLIFLHLSVTTQVAADVAARLRAIQSSAKIVVAFLNASEAAQYLDASVDCFVPAQPMEIHKIVELHSYVLSVRPLPRHVWFNRKHSTWEESP